MTINISSEKFGRNYTLDIETSTGEIITIKDPFTLRFNVIRNILASMNTGDFTIVNLSESNRRKIFQDIWNTLDYRRITLKAGYGLLQPVVFQGNIKSAFTTRNGVDWETKIQAWDGGFDTINGYVMKSYESKYNLTSILNDLIAGWSKVKVGKIANFTQKYTRGVVYVGNIWKHITEITRVFGHNFIDNEQVYIIQRDQVLNDIAFVIDSSSGLLGTPRRYEQKIEIKMLFEPRIRVGQLVRVSSLETINNGLYKVVGITHSGVISGSEAGECTTIIQAWNPDDTPLTVAR